MKRLNPFEKWLHSLFGWNLYKAPRAESVPVSKERATVTVTDPIDWPELFDGLRLRGKSTWKCSHDGRIPGSPMQNGRPEFRTVTWGWHIWGEQNIAKIPKPERGDYWLTGAPVEMFDRHCIIAAPDGTVHELDPVRSVGPAVVPQQPGARLGEVVCRRRAPRRQSDHRDRPPEAPLHLGRRQRRVPAHAAAWCCRITSVARTASSRSVRRPGSCSR